MGFPIQKFAGQIFFQAEDGIRDQSGDWSSDVCSSDLSLHVKVKQKQFDQLADFINAYSNGASIVLGGDFNAKWADNSSKEEYQQVWENFLATTGLRLACQDFTGSSDDSIANCAYDYKADTDQILYRDSHNEYELTIDSYEILDFNGVSDHEPNRAVFSWSKR